MMTMATLQLQVRNFKLKKAQKAGLGTCAFSEQMYNKSGIEYIAGLRDSHQAAQTKTEISADHPSGDRRFFVTWTLLTKRKTSTKKKNFCPFDHEPDLY